MYLVTWSEKDGRIEASLGGRITAEEMAVFVEEMQGVLETLASKPYLLQIDHSKAKRFDAEASSMLEELKDFCLLGPENAIVTVVSDEDEVARLTTERLQLVLEGRELIATPESVALWIADEAVATIAVRRAA